jgi:hypothetical protein
MGLFDRFKKKAEELYNNISSSIEGLMKKDNTIETVSVIPTAPIDTGTNTTTITEKEYIKKIATSLNAIDNTHDLTDIPKFPILDKGAINFDKNAHLTFFKDDNYRMSLDGMKELMKIKDLEFLDSERSQKTVQYMKNMSFSLENKSAFINDVEYNAKFDELKDILKQFSNKIQTMRNEHEVLGQLDGASIHLGTKDSLPPDEGTLMHRINTWTKIKNTVDTFGPEYDFYSNNAEYAIMKQKANVQDNNYITCGKLISAEHEVNRLNLDSLNTLKNLKDEFTQHGVNGQTFKQIIEGIKAYKEFDKLDDSFKTPRMQASADNFRAKAEVFCKIADSLQKTGNIPELEKGIDLGPAFNQQITEFDKKHPKIKDEGPSRPKVTVS